jgi:hypothetical protein
MRNLTALILSLAKDHYEMVHPTRFERVTSSFGGQDSIGVGQAVAWNSDLTWLGAPVASKCETKSHKSAASSPPPLHKLRFERVRDLNLLGAYFGRKWIAHERRLFPDYEGAAQRTRLPADNKTELRQ